VVVCRLKIAFVCFVSALIQSKRKNWREGSIKQASHSAQETWLHCLYSNDLVQSKLSELRFISTTQEMRSTPSRANWPPQSRTFLEDLCEGEIRFWRERLLGTPEPCLTGTFQYC